MSSEPLTLSAARSATADALERFRTDEIPAMREHVGECDALATLTDEAILLHKQIVKDHGKESPKAQAQAGVVGRAKDAEKLCAQHPPSAKVLQVSAGVGKTRAAGALFDGSLDILIAQPTNDLAKEFRDHVSAHGHDSSKLQLIHGPDAIDPDGDGKTKMCLASASTDELLRSGGSLSQMCGDEENRCSFFHECGIQRMVARLKSEDSGRIYATSHARLAAGGVIEGISQDNPLDALILDEKFVEVFADSNGKKHYLKSLAQIPTVELDKYSVAATAIIPEIVEAIENEWAAWEMRRQSDDTLRDSCGVDFLLYGRFSSAAFGDWGQKRAVLADLKLAVEFYHSMAEIELAKFKPNMSAVDSRALAKTVRPLATRFKRTANLLAGVREAVNSGCSGDGRFVVSEEIDRDGKPELVLIHRPLRTLHAGYAANTAILITNAYPEPNLWMEQVLTYDIKMGSVSPRFVTVQRGIQVLATVLAEICPNVQITAFRDAPTSNRKIQGWNSHEREYFKKQVDGFDQAVAAGRWGKVTDWPDTSSGSEGSHRNTATNNRNRVLRFAEELSEGVDGGFLFAGKKTLSSWIKHARGQNTAGFDYLSFGKSSGINSYQGHKAMVLWGYDRVSADALADFIGCVTGSFIENRSLVPNIPQIALRGRGTETGDQSGRIYANTLMHQSDEYRRHSTVLQSVERLRIRHQKGCKRHIYIAVKGSLPFAVDRVVQWQRVGHSHFRADQAKLITGVGVTTNLKITNILHSGRFHNQESLKFYLKSVVEEHFEEHFRDWGTKGSQCKEVIDSYTLTPLGSPCSKIEFRETGTRNWSTYYHAHASSEVAFEFLFGKCADAGIEIEQRSEVQTIALHTQDLPTGWRKLMSELGIHEGAAKSLAREIKKGLLEDTHRPIEIRELRDGVSFGRKIVRMVQRNINAAQFVKERFGFNNFTVNYPELG